MTCVMHPNCCKSTLRSLSLVSLLSTIVNIRKADKDAPPGKIIEIHIEKEFLPGGIFSRWKAEIHIRKEPDYEKQPPLPNMPFTF